MTQRTVDEVGIEGLLGLLRLVESRLEGRLGVSCVCDNQVTAVLCTKDEADMFAVSVYVCVLVDPRHLDVVTHFRRA